jgi:hypothetical protein
VTTYSPTSIHRSPSQFGRHLWLNWSDRLIILPQWAKALETIEIYALLLLALVYFLWFTDGGDDGFGDDHGDELDLCIMGTVFGFGQGAVFVVSEVGFVDGGKGGTRVEVELLGEREHGD